MKSRRFRISAGIVGALVVGVAALLPSEQVAAATPSTLTLGVGESKVVTGGPLFGQPAIAGAPAPVCLEGQCEQVEVTTTLPSANYTDTHDLVLSIMLDFDNSLGDCIDLAVISESGGVLASPLCNDPGTVVRVGGIKAGTYTVEFDANNHDLVGTGFNYSATLSLSATSKAPPRTLPRGKVRFSRETIADPFRSGSEPSLVVARDGTTYASPIFGFSTTMSFLLRSDDGGQRFNVLGVPGVGKVDNCGGGGDSSLTTDNFSGDIFMTDLAGLQTGVPVRASGDKGNSWVSACLANDQNGANYFHDRQWISADTIHHRLWFTYRDGAATYPGPEPADGMGIDVQQQGYGAYVKWAPLPTAADSVGQEQVTFTSMCTNAGVDAACFSNHSQSGTFVTDNSPSSPYAGRSYLALSASQGVSLAIIDPDNAKNPVRTKLVRKGASNVLFPTVAVDRAGQLYMAWTDKVDYQLRFTSSRDGGVTWSKPQLVNANGSGARVTVMPWIVAGSKGRVDLAFYASALDDAPSTNYGPWYGYMLQTMNGASKRPTWTQTRFTDRPMHIAPVCLSGLTCSANVGPGGDRQLGDFFQLGIDKDGRAVIAFADGNNDLGDQVGVAQPSFTHIVRQSRGPSLYASVGHVPRIAKPLNSVTYPEHDNPVPFVDLQTSAPGENVPALNLRASSIRRNADGSLTAKIKLSELDFAKATSSPALGYSTYMVRWEYHHQVFFVAAETSGGEPTYFAGKATPSVSSTSVKYAYYPNTAPASGVIDQDRRTITITVPADAVGSPVKGSKLFSVTAYALTHPTATLSATPSPMSPTDLPWIADSLPPYNAVLGS